jgi:hypothetical protein
MASGRAADREDPGKSRRNSARSLDRDPISELHQGQRSYAPHRRAGHMTAPDHSASAASKILARGGRPHMIYGALLIWALNAIVYPAEQQRIGQIMNRQTEVIKCLTILETRGGGPTQAWAKLFVMWSALALPIFLLALMLWDWHYLVSQPRGRNCPAHDAIEQPVYIVQFLCAHGLQTYSDFFEEPEFWGIAFTIPILMFGKFIIFSTCKLFLSLSNLHRDILNAYNAPQNT